MKFMLRSEKVKNNAIIAIQNAPIDPLHEVIVQPRKDPRTIAQNSLMWKWYYEISIQQATEYGDFRDKDYWHYKLRLEFLPILGTVSFQGIEVPIPSSTRNLGKKKFSEYLRNIEVWAGNKDISLSYPEDYYLAMGER